MNELSKPTSFKTFSPSDQTSKVYKLTIINIIGVFLCTMLIKFLAPIIHLAGLSSYRKLIIVFARRPYFYFALYNMLFTKVPYFKYIFTTQNFGTPCSCDGKLDMWWDWRLRTAASTGLFFVPAWLWCGPWYEGIRLALTPNLSTRTLWQPPVLWQQRYL
jgi:hypothetical protein